MYKAVIIDTLSIQSYVFGSNKLKENIGSSYIIERLVYCEMIPLALRNAEIIHDINMDEWVSNQGNDYKLLKDSSCRVEIGYIGGGNALLIFRTDNDAKLFVNTYSRQLLAYFPGLRTAYGYCDFNYEDGEAYKSFRKALNDNLIRNRNLHASQALPFKHGIVEDCPWTNEGQEVKDTQSGSWISQMAQSRVQQVIDAQEYITSTFKDQIGEKFTFTNELEEFGQPDDKGYIAIVHADGNGMGQRFIGCQSLAETRRLSAGVGRFANNVMKQLMAYIANDLFGVSGKLSKSEDWKLDFTKDGQWILPIRPLIIGGDDITFVCEGRLGVHLAERLLEYMHQTPINGETIHACAGVAIVHTKYPFYKAYQLAEELTKQAKAVSRKEDSSWLGYMISTGGFSGSLENIIADQFTISGKGKLRNGPYRVDGNVATLPLLHQGMKIFSSEWPRNKVKDLRDALRRDEAHENYFLTEMKARGLHLQSGDDSLWKEGKTPYYDMIELLDFYPEKLL